MADIVIYEPNGGLGDHLKYSTLPALYARQGDTVWMHTRSHFRNDGVRSLVMRNPHIKGYRDARPSVSLTLRNHEKMAMPQGLTNTQRVEYAYFGRAFNRLPRVYYKPKPRDDMAGKVFVDLRTITAKEDAAALTALARDMYGDIVEAEGLADIFGYCDAIASCATFVCAHSGSFNLAAALDVPDAVCLMSPRVFDAYAAPGCNGTWMYGNVRCVCTDGRTREKR
jgi:hypothetical protein